MKKTKALLSVKFNSKFGDAELMNLFEQNLEPFRNVPGLIQKYYLSEDVTGAKSGIYIFETEKDRAAFWASDLAKDIPGRYGVKLDTLRVEQFDIEIELNEGVLV